MNKNELAEIMAQAASISKTEAGTALDAFLQSVQKTLKEGEKVAIAGFGGFETGQRAARTGRNPQTGQPINIPASTVVKFKAGKALKEAVNQ